MTKKIRKSVGKWKQRDQVAAENQKLKVAQARRQVMLALEMVMQRPVQNNDLLLRPRFHNVSAVNAFDVKCTAAVSFPGLYMQHPLGELEIEGEPCSTEDEATTSALRKAFTSIANGIDDADTKAHTAKEVTQDLPSQTEIQEFYDAKLNELQAKQTREHASKFANDIVSYAILQEKTVAECEHVNSATGSQRISMSDCSKASKVSLISGCDCFLADALFKTCHGSHVMFIRAGDLAVGSVVLAASGRSVSVRALQSRTCEQELVSIYTANATLKVTAGHRVMAQRRCGQ
jgi:hypothetical protein